MFEVWISQKPLVSRTTKRSMPPIRKLSFPILLFTLIAFLSNTRLKAQDQPTGKELFQKTLRTESDTILAQALLDYAIYLEGVNLDSSSHYYERAGLLSRQLNYYNGMQRYASNYTYVLNIQGRTEESRKLNTWALAQAVQKKDPLGQAKGHNNLGNSYLSGGNYDSAIHHYLKAAAFLEELKLDVYLATLYSNIMVTLDGLGRYDQSIEYGLKSLEYSLKVEDSAQYGATAVNIASLLTSKKSLDSSLYYINLAIPVLLRNGPPTNLISAYITRGDAESQIGRYSEAIATFNSAIRIAEDIRDSASIAVASHGVANAHFRMKNYTSAEKFINRSLQIIHAVPGINQAQIYKLAADVKAKLGSYKQGYELLEKYVLLNDSLTGMETRKNVAELERKYQSELKTKELLEQRLRIREHKEAIRRKNTLLILLSIAIALASAAALIYYRFYQQRKKLHARELKSIEQQRELDRLKAGMEGQLQERRRIAAEMHDDLGSGLTSILYLADTTGNSDDNQKMEKIHDTAAGVMNKMNEIIWSMSAEYDTLADLIAYIRRHTGELLSKVDLDYSFEIPDQIPEVRISGEERRNINLVIKEAVHNIIKHANATKVNLSFSIDDSLRVCISDNGRGIGEKKNRFGNGLRNMRERMEAMGGTIEITERNPTGTTVIIILPL